MSWTRRSPPSPSFCIRCSALHCYDVEEEPEQVVKVRAVGIKIGNQVRIGGEVIRL
jgi:hypothetical protein